MGQFLFDVPETVSDFFEASLWSEAYICGIEGVPWQCRVEYDDRRLTVSRSVESSGKLYLTCPIEGLGYRTVSTCSLRPLGEPHLLPLELARGSCFRARVQSAAWRRAGLSISEKFDELLARGTEQFLDAAQQRGNPADSATAAAGALTLLEQAIAELGEAYAVQSISFRKHRDVPLGTLLAGSVIPPSPATSPHVDRFRAAFNAAAVRLSWADIETDAGRFDYEAADQAIRWCTSQGIRVIGGPLIDFRRRLMPHWLYLLEDDFEALLEAVTSFSRRAVEHFRGSVQLWNCAAGLNTPGPLDLSDEQAMRLAVGILETVRRTDPHTPAIMTFDQPFAEYLAKVREGISPMHFADALIRSQLGMAGIGLDLRFHYQHGTLPRSGVETGQMIDRWATLGLPLLVQVAAPGGSGIDPEAIAPEETFATPQGRKEPGGEQLRTAGPIIRTLLAKQVVHGIVWDGWCDAERHVLSHAGLIDHAGRPRPMLEYLTRLRNDFLA